MRGAANAPVRLSTSGVRRPPGRDSVGRSPGQGGTTTMAQDTYAFDNARAIQRQRLAARARLLDPGSTRHLDAIGVRPGSRCLEVGAGSGSIAAWLCDRVGPDGTVVATD